MTYLETILTTRPPNLLALWPQSEASGTIASDASGNGRTGVYSGVTLGQPGIEEGLPSAFYPGTAAYTDIYTASLANVFNGGEVSVLVPFKVANLGVWSDGISRRAFTIQINAQNRILFQKNTTTGLSVFYSAGGVTKTLNKADITTSTGWNVVLLTGSATANVAKLYVNGVLTATSTGNLGVWTGVLNAATTVIGAGSTAPNQVFNGWIGPVAIWDTALSAEQALVLAGPVVEDPPPEPTATFTYRNRPLVFTYRNRPLLFTFRGDR